jgi:hypothetical protein
MGQIVLLLFGFLTFQSQVLFATLSEENAQYHLGKIKRIEAAYFGASRLYFDLACNERFKAVLTKKESNSVRIGILTQTHPSQCNQPPKETFVRHKTENYPFSPVTHFNEVWRCSGICYIITDPEVSPYHPVEEYGTSEKQVSEKIPCYPSDQINMVCERIDIV